MIYRNLGGTGIKVPILGLGGLRLNHINENTALTILKEAIIRGINWVETSSSYGLSEKIIGDFNRRSKNKFNVITKVAPWEVSEEKYFQEFFEKQRKTLDINKFQLYLAYCIKSLRDYEENFVNNGLLSAIQSYKEKGLIDHIGCSIHASPKEIITILDDKKFEVVELYYNAITHSDYSSVVKYCLEKNIGIMSMGPLHGGILSYDSERLPDTIEKKFKSKSQRMLSWQFSQRNISISFVGCESSKHLFEALDVVNEIEKKSSEISLIYNSNKNVKVCTSCCYCEPCPHEILIPTNLKFHRLRTLFGSDIEVWIKEESFKIIKEGMRAEDCIECGECLDKCPQGLNIPKLLKDITRYGDS